MRITLIIATTLLSGCATSMSVHTAQLPDGTTVAGVSYNQPKIPLLRSGIDNLTMLRCMGDRPCEVFDPSQGAVNVDGFLGDVIRAWTGNRQARGFERGMRGVKSTSVTGDTTITASPTVDTSATGGSSDALSEATGGTASTGAVDVAGASVAPVNNSGAESFSTAAGATSAVGANAAPTATSTGPVNAEQ